MHPRQVVHFGLLLGVHRLQFFIQRLHLLLGGGQLFIGRLELFIGRLQLFVGGRELFLRCMHLFASRLHLDAHLLELLLQFGKGGAARRKTFGAPLARLFHGRNHVGKDDHHHPPQFFRLCNRLDSDIDRERVLFGPDLEIFDGDLFFLPQCLLKSTPQIKTEPVAGHRENIPVSLTRRRLKIFAGLATDIKNIPLVVDKDG